MTVSVLGGVVLSVLVVTVWMVLTVVGPCQSLQ